MTTTLSAFQRKMRLPPSEHWFGTDKMGRDLFTRVWIGGRISMILGIAGAAIDMLIGVVYGGVAAYFGGKTDAIMMRIVEILASIPYLLLVVLVSLIVGKGVGSLLIAMCLTGLVPYGKAGPGTGAPAEGPGISSWREGFGNTLV